MTFIVVDFEFNQPFTFGKAPKTPVNAICPFEIIQIGAVKLSGGLREIDRMNLMIKPTIYRRMHPYVEKITGIRGFMLKGKKAFPDIYDAFANFVGGSGESVLCVWGPTDMKLLHRNIMYHKLDGERITNRFIDVQQLLALYKKMPGGMHTGLQKAVEMMGLPVEDQFHDALNDAVYTADVFRAILTAPDRPQNLNIKTFDVDDLFRPKQEPHYAYDARKLFASVEKLYGRRMTPDEKSITRRIYLMGRAKAFDTKPGQKAEAKDGAENMPASEQRKTDAGVKATELFVVPSEPIEKSDVHHMEQA